MPAVELGPAAEEVGRLGFAADEDVTLALDAADPAAKRQRTDQSELQQPLASLGARAARSGACGSSVNNTGRGRQSQLKVRAYLRQGLDRSGEQLSAKVHL